MCRILPLQSTKVTQHAHIFNNAAAPPRSMEELLQRLTEVSIRQQQIVEHIASRQGETERELATLRMAAAQRTPPPDPRTQMFENVATREGWSRDGWARLLAPLTGEAQLAYFSLPADARESYDELKQEILARMGLSPISAAQLFHDWEYKPRMPARAQATELTRLAQHSANQVAECIVIDRLEGTS
ncbi:hypothetical protein QQF64_035987 [Cirrhinus molitorella]|uniref:Gag protein n=1 Tax=Cirrhinus molitorella TaxID=172907 RepID=A0ABR3NHI3_9TELE